MSCPRPPLVVASAAFCDISLKGRFFYRMVDDSLPQWIRTYPEETAPRTGDGLFPGEVIEVTQVCCTGLRFILLPFACCEVYVSGVKQVCAVFCLSIEARAIGVWISILFPWILRVRLGVWRSAVYEVLVSTCARFF